jgi:hypothetical protein
MTNQMIDFALAELGGGANFQQQIEAIKNEFNRQLEESTKPTSSGGQLGENATEGGATASEGTVTQNEEATEQVTETQDAIQVGSTEEVPVGERTQGSEEVGQGDTQGEVAAEGQAQEVVEPATKQIGQYTDAEWDALNLDQKSEISDAYVAGISEPEAESLAGRVIGNSASARFEIQKDAKAAVAKNHPDDIRNAAQGKTWDGNKWNALPQEVTPVVESAPAATDVVEPETKTAGDGQEATTEIAEEITPQQEQDFADLASKIAGSNLIIKCNI